MLLELLGMKIKFKDWPISAFNNSFKRMTRQRTPPATNNFYRAWRSPKKVLMQKSQKFCADFKYVNLKIELLQIFEKKSFSSLFLMRKPLSSDQKWFLRPYFPLIGGIFVLKSGLRFLFRALEVSIQKVRKSHWHGAFWRGPPRGPIMYIISLEKKTETNQGQPWATSAARQGDLLHMLYVTQAQSRRPKRKMHKDRTHKRKDKGIYCTCCVRHTQVQSQDVQR